MADPILYEVSYSFSGFQASNPSSPLPATQIDNEFAGVEASIASVAAALAEIRRGDGLLQNAVVTSDSLDDQLKAAIGLIPASGILFDEIDPSALASEAEAEAGISEDKLMTPLATKQAIDAQRAFATEDEAEAGVDIDAVMTPQRTKQALDALRAFASEAEAEAGVDTDTVMTPERTKQALDALRPVLHASQAITWGAIATLTATTQTVTVTGAAVGDRVLVGYPAAGVDDGLIMRAWVSAANTVSLRLYNTTAGPITPTGGSTWAVTVIKP